MTKALRKQCSTAMVSEDWVHSIRVKAWLQEQLRVHIEDKEREIGRAPRGCPKAFESSSLPLVATSPCKVTPPNPSKQQTPKEQIFKCPRIPGDIQTTTTTQEWSQSTLCCAYKYLLAPSDFFLVLYSQEMDPA